MVPVEDGEYVQEAKIGHAIMDADVFISLTHFKGHELTGFGGTLKNIGMGCGSLAGKDISGETGRHGMFLTPDVVEIFRSYPWPAIFVNNLMKAVQ